jgi:protein-S-isoprenylcysteine O-methyltransferase Ste14
MDFRQRLFQYRSYTPIPFLLVMIVFAHPTAISMLTGFLFVGVGEFLRLWGVAIAGSETRTTGPVGGTYLITKGPFAYVRNPLYLGNMLLYFGAGIMSNALFPWLPLLALTYFVFQYSRIVSLEEEYLLKTFKEEFVKYCESTSRFFPKFNRYRGRISEQPPLNWKTGLVSEKRTLQAIGILTILLTAFWQLRG